MMDCRLGGMLAFSLALPVPCWSSRNGHFAERPPGYQLPWLREAPADVIVMG